VGPSSKLGEDFVVQVVPPVQADGYSSGNKGQKRRDKLHHASLDRELHGPFPLQRQAIPLYHRPDHRETNRERRRHDIAAMGGVPSFYDDHMYECFDFIPKTASFSPRLTEDDEHDDYLLSSALAYRQWEGMPQLPTESDLDTEDDVDDGFG
jgi:hypothetical protein